MEVIHILAGPIVGFAITGFAFKGDRLIQRKVKAFLEAGDIEEDLAAGIEAMVSAAIALATFLGNVILTVVNCFIAIVVFPFSDLEIILLVAEVALLCLATQTSYIWAEYEVLDIGEICVVGEITYDEFLRWEQLLFNVLVTVYFF